MKATFEFDAPESCAECRLLDDNLRCMAALQCVNIDQPSNARAPFCPLQIVSDDAPTVDAAAVGAEWILVTNGRGGHECSKCHVYAANFQSGAEWLSNHCPCCGAKMGRGNDVPMVGNV